MLSNKFGGIAGAAMLGTAALLGTNAAYAVIDLSAEAADKVNPAVTYAKETLKDKVGDDSMYYVINGGAAVLDVTAELGLAGGGDGDDDLIIKVELDGMVFTADSLGETALSVAGGDSVGESAGGGKEEASATFATKRGANNNKDTVVTLEIEELGITSDGPGGITMTITNVQQRQLLTGIVDNPGANIASYAGAIAVDGGINETPTPQNPTALVSDGFKSFGMKNGSAPVNADARDLMETVGSFAIELSADDLLSAADATTVGDVSDLVDVGSNGDPVADGASSVTFTGEFSFAAMVWLDSVADCSTQSPTDLLKRDPTDSTMVTDMMALTSQTPATVMANANLCISVPMSTDEKPVSIPPTGKYAAVTTYKPTVADAPFAPSGGTHELGMIERDGTTVRFPYLTTREGYVQRIRIVSRAADGATYTMTFADNAEAGPMASGTLDKGRTTLMVSDLVTINEGGTTTSGTLNIEAQRAMIDIATTLNAPGSTDTVLH